MTRQGDLADKKEMPADNEKWDRAAVRKGDQAFLLHLYQSNWTRPFHIHFFRTNGDSFTCMHSLALLCSCKAGQAVTPEIRQTTQDYFETTKMPHGCNIG
jgi:hypothetical protein